MEWQKHTLWRNKVYSFPLQGTEENLAKMCAKLLKSDPNMYVPGFPKKEAQFVVVSFSFHISKSKIWANLVFSKFIFENIFARKWASISNLVLEIDFTEVYFFAIIIIIAE